jgi:hypothetical protein
VFAPTRVTRANVRGRLRALAARARDNGSQVRNLGEAGAQLLDTGRDTNLDRAFAAAGLVSPGAQARMLITDGGHNEAAYANAHRRGARTYVAALGVRPGGDAARLRRIARETRGRYLPQPVSDLVVRC